MTEPQDAPATEPDTDPSPDSTSPDSTSRVPGHLAPDDVGHREWVDPSKDPTPGYPGHAAPEDQEEPEA